jgi:hypothetical protein
MIQIKTYQILTYFIATVWLINGLFCKVLNLVPRHEEIVGSVLGNLHSEILTILIGVSEIIMAIWVLSGFKSKISTSIRGGYFYIDKRIIGLFFQEFT